MNGKIELLPEHHGDSEDLSYLVFLFLSTDIGFFFKYRPIFIFRPESDLFPGMAGTIRYAQYLERKETIMFEYRFRCRYDTVLTYITTETIT